MKKILFALTLLSLIFFNSVFAQVGFTVSGEIKGIENGKKVTLTPGATHSSEKPMYIAIITNGKFEFKGKLDQPIFFYLGIDSTSGFTPLFIENANISIKGNYAKTVTNGLSIGVFSDMVVVGSKVHTEYLVKSSIKSDLDKVYTNYHTANSAILDSLKNITRGSEEYKKLILSPNYKKFEADEHAFFTNVAESYKKAVVDNSKTFWGPFLMMSLMSYFSDEQKPWFEAMSPEAQNSYYGKLVKAELYPATLMGKRAPVFSASDRNNKKFTMKELMGKYTIIDFWASWCAPCRKEIPNLKKLYAEYHSKGLSIISISLDKEDAKWKTALDEEKLPWANLIDKDEIAKNYGVVTIPDMFILDKSGKVIWIKLRGESLAIKLKELFL
jgi:thiol-disulfide isomerase/thioredoxin